MSWIKIDVCSDDDVVVRKAKKQIVSSQRLRLFGVRVIDCNNIFCGRYLVP